MSASVVKRKEKRPAASVVIITLYHMFDEAAVFGWLSVAHDCRPARCTVVSVISEPVKRSEDVTLSLLCLLGPTLRCFPYGAGCRSVRRRAHRHQLLSPRRLPVSPYSMGLEKEKSDTSIIMDEDEFNRSIEPILSKKGKVYEAAPDRDPNDINAHLKVGFEDVIAEPISSHSFDRVWIGSHAAFELVKFIFYRLLTTLLAVPMAFILGVVFGVLSCIHIWLVMPVIQCFLMLLPSVQVVWRSLTDMFVTPLFHSMGKVLSSIQVKTTEN